MIKLPNFKFIFVVIMIITIFSLTPMTAYSNEINEMISTIDSPYNVSLQYVIRDNQNALICVVESTVTKYYDSPSTLYYLNTHQNHTTIQKNNQIFDYVVIKDSWRVGEGDSFLSTPKHAIRDMESGEFTIFFSARTNACAIEPGDVVTAYWKILYSQN